MGFETEFNWYIVDKRDPKSLENLAVGETGRFEKSLYRIYPTESPLFLLDKDWNALGAAEVTSYTFNNHKTIVNYKVTDLFDEQERIILTKIIKRMHKK